MPRVTFEFDPKQQEAIDRAITFIKDYPPVGRRFQHTKPSFRIGGYAGTGKTTISKEIIHKLTAPAPLGLAMRVKSCAFAGKAAHVLRRKDIPAETIHRTIYDWDDRNERFERKDNLGCDVIHVDEGSMVPSDLWEDLRSYGLPIIVTGDPGQLEPIGQDARLMHEPDIVLDTVHRYDGNIARFANHIRMNEGEYPWQGIEFSDLSVKPMDQFQNDYNYAPQERKPNVILCAYNKTRVALNQWVRKRYGNHHEFTIGEQLICLHNNRDLGVFNGLTMVVDHIHGRYSNYTLADVTFDDGRKKHGVKLWHGSLDSEKPPDWRKYPKDNIIVDYGYAKTVHKMQGSEEPIVAVLDEVRVEQTKAGYRTDTSDAWGWDIARWRYTAFTRASERLLVYRQ